MHSTVALFNILKKEEGAPQERPVPQHIAVIMDGNGRWAKKRGLPRTAGHKVGAETFRNIATYCKDIGVKYFTVYAFSTENWKRPQDEVDGIMRLLKQYLHECIDTMERDRNRLRFLGDLSVLDEETRALICQTDEISARIDGFQANICLNYGGRGEIVHAARAFAADCAALSLLRRAALAGAAHSSRRREAHQQLSFVAVRLQRILLYRHAVA